MTICDRRISAFVLPNPSLASLSSGSCSAISRSISASPRKPAAVAYGWKVGHSFCWFARALRF